MTLLRAVLWSCLVSASAVLADYSITVDGTNGQAVYAPAGAWQDLEVSAPFSPQSTCDSSFIGTTGFG
jgi:hypothetical protein